MPLIKSSTREAVSQNIRTEMAEGKPQRQAIAIALNTARHAKRRSGGKVKGYDAGGRTDAVNAVINALEAGSAGQTGGDGSNPGMAAPTTGLPTLPTSNPAVTGPQSPAPNTGPNVGLPLLPGTPSDATSNPNSQLPPQGLPGASNATSTVPFNTGVGSGGGLQYPGVPNPASRGGMHRGGLAHLAMGGVGVQPTPWYVRSEAHNLTHEGPIMSAVPGRTDRHNMNLASGSYVIPSAVVSHLGQSNTLSGMKILGNMFGAKPPKMGMGAPKPPRLMGIPGDKGGARGEGTGVPVPVVTAGGEYVIPPEVVARIGDGDIKYGHKILDAWVVQKIKEYAKVIKKLPPPAKA